MFQIASVYGISKMLNIECDFPNIKQLIDKLKTLYNYNHGETIFRNVPINNNIIFNETINESSGRICDEFMINYIHNSINNIMINGYLEDVKYFENYRDDILKLFEPDNDSYNYIMNKYFKNIENYNIVSVHYRLNDFSEQPDNDYYKNACNYIIEKTTNPFFYIFADDISMVDLSIYKDLDYKLIDKEVDYIHLWMISLCKHNIISFSTLSWWGAYLNNNDNKIVICNNTRSWNSLSKFILL